MRKLLSVMVDEDSLAALDEMAAASESTRSWVVRRMIRISTRTPEDRAKIRSGF